MALITGNEVFSGMPSGGNNVESAAERHGIEKSGVEKGMLKHYRKNGGRKLLRHLRTVFCSMLLKGITYTYFQSAMRKELFLQVQEEFFQ